MVTTFGITESQANEIVVKPYDNTWVLVRKDAYDFFMNTINDQKFKITILEEKVKVSEEGRQKEYDQFILERQAKEALIQTLTTSKEVAINEMNRLNQVVSKQGVQIQWLDTLLKISLAFNVYQAFD